MLCIFSNAEQEGEWARHWPFRVDEGETASLLTLIFCADTDVRQFGILRPAKSFIQIRTVPIKTNHPMPMIVIIIMRSLSKFYANRANAYRQQKENENSGQRERLKIFALRNNYRNIFDIEWKLLLVTEWVDAIRRRLNGRMCVVIMIMRYEWEFIHKIVTGNCEPECSSTTCCSSEWNEITKLN